MSYKIVETVERGKRVLSVVPKNWEENGILKWPQKNYDKLKLDPNSKPDKSWLPMQCKIKRNTLQSYDSAEMEMNIMSDVTDTDLEADELCGVPPVTSKKGFNFDFNELVRSSIKDQEGHLSLTENKVSVAPTQIPTAFSAHELVSPSYIVQEAQATIDLEESHLIAQKNPAEINLQNLYFVTDAAATGLSTESQSHTYNEILSKKIDNLTTIAQELQNNQQNILLKLASVTTLVEEYMKKITYKEITSATSTNFKIINDVHMLQEFENSLENPDLRLEYMKKLSIVCSKGKGRGINNAYVLVDVMFCRKLMTQCSWAGGTRKNNPKSCFKAYSHTINLFFDIIHNTDKDFTKTECNNFFKNVLRHSVARSSSQQLRCSAAKRRPKKNDSTKEDGGRTSNLAAQPSTSQSIDEVDKENIVPIANNSQPSTP